MKTVKGKAYVVRDDINTDLIIPARYQNTYDHKELAMHALEDLDPKDYPVPFINMLGTSDYKVIIAGKNFGCGSSREHAPVALNAAGIEAVVAKTFARIYYRNSINGGRTIYPIEIGKDITSEFDTGDEVEVAMDEGMLVNHTKGKTYLFRPLEGIAKQMIDAGGITEYNLKKMGKI